MKKYLLSLSFIVLFLFQSTAQKHEFIFYTRSGEIQVFVNGQLDGEINKGGKYSVKVKFNEETPSNTLSLRKVGFEDKDFVYDSKPDKNATKIFWAMQKEKFKLSEKNDYTFKLVRVKYDISPDEQISTISGYNTYWSSIDVKESDVEVYKKNVNNELIQSGFNGLLTDPEEDDLFGDSKSSAPEQESDISIGAIIKDLKIGGVFSPYYPSRIYDLSTKIEVEWQFYNNATEELIIKVTTHEESFMVKETGEVVRGINLAFGENFAEALRQPEVISAILAVESGKEKTFKEDVLKEYTILKPSPKSFESSSEMIKSINPAVVTIKGSKGHGSGFVISKDGYIVTNYHVVKNNNDIKVLFQMGFELPAEILNYSEEHDLALLKVMGSGFTSLELSNTQAELGEEVIAIGTPNTIDLSNTVTKGIVSGNRKSDNDVEFIQTDVSVSPGNSGSPLINSKGQVIGIISEKLVGIGTEGIAFAIPIKFALTTLNITVQE